MGKLRRISEKMALCNLTMEKSPKSILLGIEILDIFIDFLRKIRQSWISREKRNRSQQTFTCLLRPQLVIYKKVFQFQHFDEELVIPREK